MLTMFLLTNPALADLIQLDGDAGIRVERSEGKRLVIQGVLAQEVEPREGHGLVLVERNERLEGWVGDVRRVELDGDRVSIELSTVDLLEIRTPRREERLRVDVQPLEAHDPRGIWGTNGASIFVPGLTAIWGTGGVAIWGTTGAAVWGDVVIVNDSAL